VSRVNPLEILIEVVMREKKYFRNINEFDRYRTNQIIH